MILARPTEKVVADSIFRSTGFRPRDVTCPSGVAAEAGGTFQCHFTGPDGKYVAYLRILSVKGTRVDYNIRSVRAGSSAGEQGQSTY